MLRPADWPPASNAPLLPASMMPGPPPVMTPRPALARRREVSSAALYIGSDGLVRALPNMETAVPTRPMTSNPSTNSAMMRKIRQLSLPVISTGMRVSPSDAFVGAEPEPLRVAVVALVADFAGDAPVGFVPRGEVGVPFGGFVE